jgi:hypothetical protein
MFWWRHLWGWETIWVEGWNVELIANVWAQKKCSSCKHSQSLARNNLTKLLFPYSSLLVLLKVIILNAIEGIIGKGCQAITFMGFWANLFNGKHVFYTPWHNIVGMQEYNHGWRKPKWKVPRTSRWVTWYHVVGGRGWWLELWLDGNWGW